LRAGAAEAARIAQVMRAAVAEERDPVQPPSGLVAEAKGSPGSRSR
jgi:hypothetical protein